MGIENSREDGFLDEAELFADDNKPAGQETSNSPMDGERIDQGAAAPEYEQPVTPGLSDEGAGGYDLDPATGLDGVELFLSEFGVNGGMIDYEDGASVHFSELPPKEQESVLRSLTQNAIPTVEEKFNLEKDEIELLNAFRESGMTNMGEFLNTIVDQRVGSYLDQKDALGINYDVVDNDDLFIYHLKNTKEDFSDEELADELIKAKQLATYDDTIGAIRDSYKAKQYLASQDIAREEQSSFYNEIEQQRAEIVQSIEDMQDIAGAPLTPDMKEYLLNDMMEMNEHNDPILMEKIFSNPQSMLKANWFLTYGEDYIGQLNDYWKKQVSSAYKKGYDKSINGMPENPTVMGINTPKKSRDLIGPTGIKGFGQEVTEEDLFEE